MLNESSTVDLLDSPGGERREEDVNKRTHGPLDVHDDDYILTTSVWGAGRHKPSENPLPPPPAPTSISPFGPDP